MSPSRPRPAAPPFEEALRLLPAPVGVIGAAADGTTGGLTAAWLTRVSLDPPLLLVAVGRERFTHGLLAASPRFTVSLPTCDQVEVARRFGLQSRREVDKWALTPHVLLGEGVPALRECSARFLCERVGQFATGDHDCFVGRVLSAEIVAGPPALPLRGADYAPRTG